MRSFVCWVLNHARLVLIVILFVTLGLAFQLRKLYLTVNLDANLPSTHPYVTTFNLISEEFGQREIVVLALQNENGTVLEPQFLKMISAITDDLQAIPHVTANNVMSLTSRKVKDIQGNREGLEVKRFVEKIPTTPAELAELRARVSRNPIYQRTLISDDLKTTAILIDFKQAERPAYVEDERNIRQVVDKHLISGARYGLNGVPITLSAFAKYTARIKIYFALAIVIVGLIHFEAFRSVQGLLLPLVTALLSVIWATGFLCLIGLSKLEPVTAPTPILILAVAAGHAVQILKRYYEEFERYRDNYKAVEESLVKVGPVMILAGAVAALSFLSLLAFDVPAIRDFGLYSAFGVMAALIIELTFTPALRVLLPAPQEAIKESALLDRTLEWVSTYFTEPRYFKRVLSVAMVLLLTFIGFSTRVEVDNASRLMLPKDEPLRLADPWMNKALGGTETLSFLIEGAEDSMKRPDVLRAVDGFQTMLEQHPYIGKTLGLPYFVKTMHQAMHEAKPEYFAIPNSQDLIAQ